jgi:16S rRNA (cytosine967-C5)-methyltransferase
MSVGATSKGGGRVENRPGRADAVSPARAAAFEILRRVEAEGAFASVLLASIAEEGLSAQDRALCHELVLGTLRWQLWLDHLISYYARRSADKLDAPVRLVLRLGLYQLRFLSRIPASAAVNESVKLVRRARVRSADSFVNAVLRRATREPAYDPASGMRDALERISVGTSHPLWLIERWANNFGVEETAAFARSNNEATPVAFRLTGEEAVGAHVLEELRAAGGELEASRIALDAWRVRGAGARLRELAGEGLVYLQDEASQLVAQVLDARAGERVLDACAAPGSKTTHIAARARNQAFVVAGDLYEHRARTLLETSARQKSLAVRALVYDAEVALPFADGSFDRALVDAPCTGTGTLRRNPEIRWRISPSDVALLAARQKRILCNTSELVRRGGRLVYSTCSVEPEENEQVVEAFLRERQDFEQVFVQAPAPLLSEKGAARTWPQRDGADGFFIAAFERRS